MTENYKRFGFLSIILSFIVSSYWIIRPLRDALFSGMVGTDYLPYAKIFSVIFLILIIIFYSKLIDLFDKKKLIYAITIFFGFSFLVMSLLLTHPVIGIHNTVQSKYRIIGWVFYFLTDSFISLIYTLFWAFISSFIDTQSAKQGYPIILAGAQIGAIVAPELVKHVVFIGVPGLVFISSILIFLIPILIMIFSKLYLNNINYDCNLSKKKTGFIEGIRLLINKPYLMGIFVIASFGTVIATIFELKLIYLAKQEYVYIEKVSQFLGFYGQSINIATLVIALLGTGFFIKKFGLFVSLLVYPLLTLFVLIGTFIYPSLNTLFISMVLVKSLAYAFNVPVKEMMYIPTSSDVKFKSKVWIDGIGDQIAKGAGGGLSYLFLYSFGVSIYGFLFLFIIFFIWINTAIFLGKTNYKLIKNKTIIE